LPGLIGLTGSHYRRSRPCEAIGPGRPDRRDRPGRGDQVRASRIPAPGRRDPLFPDSVRDEALQPPPGNRARGLCQLALFSGRRLATLRSRQTARPRRSSFSWPGGRGDRCCRPQRLDRRPSHRTLQSDRGLRAGLLHPVGSHRNASGAVRRALYFRGQGPGPNSIVPFNPWGSRSRTFVKTRHSGRERAACSPTLSSPPRLSSLPSPSGYCRVFVPGSLQGGHSRSVRRRDRGLPGCAFLQSPGRTFVASRRYSSRTRAPS